MPSAIGNIPIEPATEAVRGLIGRGSQDQTTAGTPDHEIVEGRDAVDRPGEMTTAESRTTTPFDERDRNLDFGFELADDLDGDRRPERLSCQTVVGMRDEPQSRQGPWSERRGRRRVGRSAPGGCRGRAATTATTGGDEREPQQRCPEQRGEPEAAEVW